jgi:CRP-like cAMP-binding protein
VNRPLRFHIKRTADDVHTLLSRLEPFAASSPAEIRAIARSCTIVTCGAGTILAREGVRTREFFVIASGTALVTRQGVADVTLHPGDPFGAIDLLTKSESSAGLIALSDVDLVVMSSIEFLGLLDEAPSFRRRVMTRLAERARVGASVYSLFDQSNS